jgi:hypothetical protein
MTFDVEVVLKGRDCAVRETLAVASASAGAWTEGDVRHVLVEILRAVNRAEHPDAPLDQPVMLHGFSWIVEPVDGAVVIAIEIPMGAAVAGPFATDGPRLDALITSVLTAERRLHRASPTVH